MPHRVLVIDDNADHRELMTRCLRRLGFDASSAGDGAAGLVAIRRAPPDVVLLDYTMPDMDGLEVLGRLRADPDTRGQRVVMFTAVNDGAVRARADRLGVADYLLKGSTTLQLILDVLGPRPPPAGPPSPLAGEG